jgi:hypothetical protein
MNGWIKIRTTRSLPEANIMKGMLEENNIAAVLLNRQDSSYLVFGEIELYVQPQFKDIAKHLLDQALMN